MSIRSWEDAVVAFDNYRALLRRIRLCLEKMPGVPKFETFAICEFREREVLVELRKAGEVGFLVVVQRIAVPAFLLGAMDDSLVGDDIEFMDDEPLSVERSIVLEDE